MTFLGLQNKIVATFYEGCDTFTFGVSDGERTEIPKSFFLCVCVFILMCKNQPYCQPYSSLQLRKWFGSCSILAILQYVRCYCMEPPRHALTMKQNYVLVPTDADLALNFCGPGNFRPTFFNFFLWR